MTWDFAYGDPFTEQVAEEILHSIEPDYIHGLSLLGGEPMEQDSTSLQDLLAKLHRFGYRIWIIFMNIIGKSIRRS